MFFKKFYISIGNRMKRFVHEKNPVLRLEKNADLILERNHIGP